MRRINEIFYSLQGEGYHTGIPAVFVRFSGCNLRCPFCDTQHEEGTLMSDEDIVMEVAKYSTQVVILTGGEPGLWIDEKLVIAVKDKADVDEAKESLTKHQQDRYNLLQSYEPKQVSRIQDGLVFTKGQYAVLIITSHNDDVRKAFEDTIKSK